MKQVGSQEARNRFRDLLDDAQRGKPTEIMRNGKAIAVLVPTVWHETVIAYMRATAFTEEAADFYDRQQTEGKQAIEIAEASGQP